MGGPDAELVAAHTFDAAEYLLDLYDGADTVFDTDFNGEIVAQITYHVPCHQRARGSGEPGQRLLALTGASVTPVEACAGVEGMWGWRRENDRVAVPLAAALGEQIELANGDVVAGDSHFANTVILEQTGRVPRHPLQVLARAYGIDPVEARRAMMQPSRKFELPLVIGPEAIYIRSLDRSVRTGRRRQLRSLGSGQGVIARNEMVGSRSVSGPRRVDVLPGGR